MSGPQKDKRTADQLVNDLFKDSLPPPPKGSILDQQNSLTGEQYVDVLKAAFDGKKVTVGGQEFDGTQNYNTNDFIALSERIVGGDSRSRAIVNGLKASQQCFDANGNVIKGKEASLSKVMSDVGEMVHGGPIPKDYMQDRLTAPDTGHGKNPDGTPRTSVLDGITPPPKTSSVDNPLAGLVPKELASLNFDYRDLGRSNTAALAKGHGSSASASPTAVPGTGAVASV